MIMRQPGDGEALGREDGCGDDDAREEGDRVCGREEGWGRSGRAVIQRGRFSNSHGLALAASADEQDETREESCTTGGERRIDLWCAAGGAAADAAILCVSVSIGRDEEERHHE
jgi:hypothetical protein